MKQKRKPASTKKRNTNINNEVLAAFILLKTTFADYCRSKNWDKDNVRKALIGEWTGKKANLYRSIIISDLKKMQRGKNEQKIMEASTAISEVKKQLNTAEA